MKKTFLIEDSEIAQAILAKPLNIAFEAGKPLPEDIQFMPPGRQKISPFVGGKPKDMEVTVTAKYAEVFNDALQQLRAAAKAGEGDLPFTDFNHEDGAASSRPTEFFWGGEDPIKGGVRLRTGWTASGKSAIEGGDFARFSPQWVFHKRTFEPLGLPVNVGGLVNRAAFKTIAPIVSASDAGKKWALAGAQDGNDPNCPGCEDLSAAAHKASSRAATAPDGEEFNAHSAAYQAHKEARDAQKTAGNDTDAEHHTEMMAFHKKKARGFANEALASSTELASTDKNKKKNGDNTMDENEIATAMAKAFAKPEFAMAVKTVVEGATAPLTAKITALETEQKNESLARAKSAVLAHVNRGALAPEAKVPGTDKLLVDHYAEQMVANAAATEMTLSMLPGRAVRRTIGQGAGGGPGQGAAHAEPVETILAQAKEARKNQPADFRTESDALIAVCRSAGGWGKYEEFREAMIAGTGQGPKKQFTVQRN